MSVTISAPDAVRVPLLPPPPLLAVNGLSRSFGPGCPRCEQLTGDAAGTSRCAACGTVIAVHEVSFEVGAGEVIGIVGESGSGKTTLLRSLHLDAVPGAGSMRVAGYGDLFTSSTPRTELRRSAVVMVHQNALAAGLSPGLAAESNVAERLLSTGCRNFTDARGQVSGLLEELGIHPSRHADPLGTFSGGMQQRVQLARALVSPPRVLLLDEPTTGLDPSVQADLLETVQRVTDKLGSATVVVSHDLDVVRILASRVLVLHYGRVVEHGIPEQVLDDPQHPYTQLLVASRLR
ncbi:ATP-binding cassette domain-containing protein [Arthrobacter sulfonylureivorans]|uniref:ATP-binding cassette domain-containing protein n=1 Tax=Arthrobacter sulfonylureivorans TaxID=2486855 RepID=A0ABY3WHN5_9MICC|nr:ATP-binding cassette domain-containing protein [Arthrobacter sulfonylureivorans]UNK47822.1 ATP-binding cassette domain-containing protein [Arthrobacter sulfonylureivorans]